MRILHFVNNINLSWHNMFVDTVRAQERRGHRVEVVFPPSGVNYKRLLADGVNVTALPVRSSKFDYHAAFKLSQILRKNGIDVLHTHLTSAAQLGASAARRAGVPCVASVLKMTKKNRYMKCDVLLPCSDAVRDDLLRQGVPPSMLRRVYTGIDIERVLNSNRPEPGAREEFGFAPEHRVIGCVARLVPMKGHTHLLDAAPLVLERRPDARFLIVGDGELRASLEAQAKALGITGQVVFAGTRLDLGRILTATDIAVLSSVDKEGLPIILVESCLFGKPAVMSDVAGISEIIRDGVTGRLVPPRDPRALADALILTLENPAEADSMAAAANTLVRREFDVNNTAAQLDEIYAAVIEKRKSV
jgi:glycosyltransferase involved in cell wall biosynthesis